MKRSSFILAAVVAIAAIGCTKVSDKTAVSGTIADGAVARVAIRLPEINLDTTVAVKNGAFSVKLPVCKTSFAEIKAGDMIGKFVSDGTPLTLKFNEDKSFAVTSKNPKASVQAKFEAFKKSLADLQDASQKKFEAIPETDQAAREKAYEEYVDEAKKISLAALAENKDNIISIVSLNSLVNEIEDSQMDSLLKTLDPSLSNVAAIKEIRQVVTARSTTGEGRKFTDFDIHGVKLSDFVGKGKYVLVDFWASWCGPCKKEIPNIKAVYEKYAGADFDVLSIAVWDKVADTEKAAGALGVTWSQIVDAQQVPTDLYGIQGIPHIILFGPDGTILKRDLRGEGIEAEVAKYVQAKK